MSRRALTAITLVVLTGLLVVGAVFGVRALFAPLPGSEEEQDATAAAANCNPDLSAGKRVRSKDVTVSVYNASSRGGLAGSTRDALAERGFLPGEAGNAPDGVSAESVVVLAPSRKDPAAQLVARQFAKKKKTVIRVTDENVGPGVDVVVGSDFPGLVKAPKRIKAKADGSGC